MSLTAHFTSYKTNLACFIRIWATFVLRWAIFQLCLSNINRSPPPIFHCHRVYIQVFAAYRKANPTAETHYLLWHYFYCCYQILSICKFLCLAFGKTHSSFTASLFFVSLVLLHFRSVISFNEYFMLSNSTGFCYFTVSCRL